MLDYFVSFKSNQTIVGRVTNVDGGKRLGNMVFRERGSNEEAPVESSGKSKEHADISAKEF